VKSYYFNEANPLIEFIEKHADKIIGHTLVNFYSEFFPMDTYPTSSDKSVVLKIDDYYVVLNYFFEEPILLVDVL
jgi:GH35 family endo-1,4-beta-xylanase